jgi:hypothetical protein
MTMYAIQKFKTVHVNPKHARLLLVDEGLIIKTIAKSAGEGCRIQHLSEKDAFIITAWDSCTLRLAEIKIKGYVKTLEKQVQVINKNQYTKPITIHLTILPWSHWILSLNIVGNFVDKV